MSDNPPLGSRRQALPRAGSPFDALALLLAASSITLSALAGEPASIGALPGTSVPATSSRVPWKTSRVVGSPEPPSPYTVELAFPHLKFDQLLLMTMPPEEHRIFVAERYGRVFSFPQRGDVVKGDLSLDLGGRYDRNLGRDVRREIYGMAFHPRFQENHFFYLFITERKPQPSRTRIARFEMDPDTWRADPESEHILLEFPSRGHDGGSLEFGPDGYLYIGTGDGGGSNDQHLTGQFIGDFLAAILRIDVDGRHSAKSYAIPPDNPFIETVGAAPEVFAYGFRQVWKMTFDRDNGDLWVGDVGQDLWEMVYRVESGGNYGWSVMEGPQEFRPRRPRGPTPIQPPIKAHHHGESRSITGGYVYRGSQRPELYGAYVYGDYETGKIWGLRHDGERVTWEDELVDTSLDIAAFGEDHDGELFVLSHLEGRLHRLVPRPPAQREQRQAQFPVRLSDTGLFTSVKDLTPAPGLIPYGVVAPLWSDGAEKERYLAIPGDGKIIYRADNPWAFPEGTVLVKTFTLELEAGNPTSRRRLETRLLTLQDGQWAGYTYLWNDAETDATLLGRGALEKTYEVRDAAAPGGVREQTWRFPSRADCMVCHNEKARFVLGLSTLQMNRDHDYGDVRTNQIDAFVRWGLFDEPPGESPEELARLSDPRLTDAPIDVRARSYLHANCSHCHRFKGGGNANLILLYATSLADTGAPNALPLHGDFGLPDARLIAPGAPERSLVWKRMNLRGAGRMPHIGTLEVDRDGVELVGEWIRSMALREN